MRTTILSSLSGHSTTGELNSPPKVRLSHNGPIGRRTHGYILTMDQSDAGHADNTHLSMFIGWNKNS
eukprot:3597981-Pyramimonas_sp.AAC.1